MNVRGMIRGVWVVGLVMVGGACGPTEPTSLGVESQTISEDSGETNGGGADGKTCGGFTGAQCPKNYTCVDDPSDSCDPSNRGADCSGICRKCGHEPNYRYVLTSPAQCAGVLFKCAAGEVAFFNDCGCGCKPG